MQPTSVIMLVDWQRQKEIGLVTADQREFGSWMQGQEPLGKVTLRS